MFDVFWKAVEKIQGAPVERKLADVVGSDRIYEDPFPMLVDGRSFEPGTCYFGIRLAGLHIVNAREFDTGRYPLCVSLAEFKQRGRDRAVPFSIGPAEMLKRLTQAGVFGGSAARPAWIELRDLTVVHPTPVGVGNLSLFVGLYSVPGDSLVKTLLDVIGNLSQSVSVAIPALAAAGPALEMTKSVYSALGSLTGSNLMRPLAQAQNGRALPGTGSGYLLVANAPVDAVTSQDLTVRHGRLCRGGKIVTDFDYCLIAIERYDSVIEQAAGIAPDLFDESWQNVLRGFGDGDIEAAGRAMKSLAVAIRGSPDLIEADKVAVLAGYLSLYTREREALAMVETVVC